MNSNAKGKRGEREARDVWRANGFTCRRTQQYCGNTGDASDIVIEECPDLHVESKRVERGNPYDWIAQASRDAALNNKYVIVHHKRNNHPPIFVLPERTLFRLLRGSDLIIKPMKPWRSNIEQKDDQSEPSAK